MKRAIVIAASAAVLVSCAKDPGAIPATYVSPLVYESYNCTQIAQEAQRISNRVAVATGQQQQARQNDAVAATVGIILFWPALFLIKGGGATEAELAQIKGQMDAIEQASIQKKCNIRFQETPVAGR